MTTGTGQSFRCVECGRRFRWRADIAGRTLRCACGEKIRCPEAHSDTSTAGQSLDDTVADVALEEHLDHIATPEAPAHEEPDGAVYRRIPQRGMFGWPMGGEVLVWGAASIVGVALAILAVIMLDYYIPYTVGALVVGPYSWWRLYHAWPRWTQGRPWLECLGRSLGAEDDEQAAADGVPR